MSDSTQTVVTHYGLHYTSEGIAYLHQGRSATNFISLKAMSPFKVETLKKKACPHLVPVAAPVPDPIHWNQFRRLLNDPLVEALLPVPRGYTDLVPYINDKDGELNLDLAALSRMSAPIYPVVMSFDQLTKKQIIEELTLTNITPLILTGCKTEHQADLEEIAAIARQSPRRLILCGDPTVVIRSPLKRIETTIWDTDEIMLASLPWETLGAAIIRRYARKEILDAPFVRREQ